MSKLLKLTKWRETRFIEPLPDLRTLRRLIDSNELKGKRIGKDYYIEVDQSNMEIETLFI
jgi:hypothetical protein